MSVTSTKRPLAAAQSDAEAMRDLLAGTYVRWDVAGSVRRQRPEVGDVEHVVQSRTAEVRVGLFGVERTVNLLHDRLDALVAAGELAKHLYGDSGVRWGDRHRGVSFHGFAHELFIADGANYGPTLAIRTGPAEFSKRLVSGLLCRGLRNHEGYVWECDPCPSCSDAQADRGIDCWRCGRRRLVPARRVSVPDERAYFELCGVGWIEPEGRR